MNYFNVLTCDMQSAPAYAASAGAAAVDAMNAETHRSMAVGEVATARRAVVAADVQYRAAVDKARPDPRTARLDAVLAAAAELEAAMAALATAKAKAAAKTAEAARTAAVWEEMDAARVQAIDALMADD